MQHAVKKISMVSLLFVKRCLKVVAVLVWYKDMLTFTRRC